MLNNVRNKVLISSNCQIKVKVFYVLLILFVFWRAFILGGLRVVWVFFAFVCFVVCVFCYLFVVCLFVVVWKELQASTGS